ncbi:MAG: hypothetical protein M1814_001407 [Vezdaea aestivalis]|nr:MAG: hypothetical protein M1814_001407 [Vezdaea aestivalis]
MDEENPDLEMNSFGPKDTVSPLNMTINSAIEMAAWQMDAPESAIFRRFDTLHTFNLLVLQNQLRILEEQLEGIRLQGKEHGAKEVKISDRSDLILEIRQTLQCYNDALAAQKAMISYAHPIRNIIDYLKDVIICNAPGAAQLYKLRETELTRREKKQAKIVAETTRLKTRADHFVTPGLKKFETAVDHCWPRDNGLGMIGRVLSVPGWGDRRPNRVTSTQGLVQRCPATNDVGLF